MHLARAATAGREQSEPTSRFDFGNADKEKQMLYTLSCSWIVANLAGVLGFAELPALRAGIAQVLFFLFLISL